MICEREEEIEAFIPQEYWSIHTIMDKDGKLFEAEVNKYKNKKIEIKNEEEANKIKEFLLNPETEFIVDKVTKKSYVPYSAGLNFDVYSGKSKKDTTCVLSLPIAIIIVLTNNCFF